MREYDRGAALVVVDVQNDFADPSGALYVPGGEERVVPAVKRETEAAVAAGAGVFYSQDWHPPRTPHFDIDGGLWPVHCVAGTWGARFHPGLGELAGPVIRKGTGGEDGYSAFTMADPQSGETAPTGLEEMLREEGRRRVTVVGLALDYCVKATALDAAAAGFAVMVPLPATAAVNLNPADEEKAITELTQAGITLL